MLPLSAPLALAPGFLRCFLLPSATTLVGVLSYDCFHVLDWALLLLCNLVSYKDLLGPLAVLW